MHIQKVFKKYMVPFLGENGFKLDEKSGNEFTYRHVENKNAYIYFTINLKYREIMPEFSHKGRPRSLPMYNLSLFLEDPDFPDTAILDGNWRFDNEEQLIGALEEQVTLLREKAIPWLMGDYKVDIEKIILTSARDREKRWNHSTEKERKIISMQFNEIFTKWENRRVYPKKWGMNTVETQ